MVRWVSTFIFLLIAVIFINSSIENRKIISNIDPRLLKPTKIQLSDLGEKIGSVDNSKENWWHVKGGIVKHDWKISSGTLWKTDTGIRTVPEYYYIPVVLSHSDSFRDTFFFIAVDAQTYNTFDNPVEFDIFNEPQGFVTEVKYIKNDISILPPYLILSYGLKPNHPVNPWALLIWSIFFLAVSLLLLPKRGIKQRFYYFKIKVIFPVFSFLLQLTKRS